MTVEETIEKMLNGHPVRLDGTLSPLQVNTLRRHLLANGYVSCGEGHNWRQNKDATQSEIQGLLILEQFRQGVMKDMS